MRSKTSMSVLNPSRPSFELQQWLSKKKLLSSARNLRVIEDALHLHDRFKDSFWDPTPIQSATPSSQSSKQQSFRPSPAFSAKWRLCFLPHNSKIFSKTNLSPRENGRSVCPFEPPQNAPVSALSTTALPVEKRSLLNPKKSSSSTINNVLLKPRCYEKSSQSDNNSLKKSESRVNPS